MSRVHKATESVQPPVCGADGKPKHIYRTKHDARTAADVAESRTYGVKFTTYKCGSHWHIAHATRQTD